MKRTGSALAVVAILSLGASPASAQASNDGKPAAPPPAKAAPLDTGVKPETVKSAGATTKKGGGPTKKKKHR